MEYTAPDIEERMRQLELIFGQRCWFSKLAEEAAQTSNQQGAPETVPEESKHTQEAIMMSPITGETDSCPRHTVMDRGDKIPKDVSVCGWKTIMAYPDTFIGKNNRSLARPFFEEAKTCGDWDFFYLYNPADSASEPEIVVPTEQFDFYLRFINRQLGVSLTLPHGKAKSRFQLRFNKDMPQPRYLASINGIWQLKDLSSMQTTDTDKTEPFAEQPYPSIDDKDVEAFSKASTISKQDWLSAWKNINKSNWIKKDLSPEERFERRHIPRMEKLKEAQQMLGIGHRKSDAVLVCVDVEWLETQPHPISEIGLAILDTRKLDFSDTLMESHNSWWKLIDAYHLRTYEYSGLRNYRYVAGCPDKFEFGTSTLPPLSFLATDVDDIVKPYRNRNIILVGHDLKSDLRCLGTLGTQFIESAVAQVDSQVLYQAWKKTDLQCSLDTVLNNLDYPYRYLHNAGNDAVHTLRAMVGIALKAREEAQRHKQLDNEDN